MALCLLLLALANVIDGAPTVVFPINSQVPPVARVSKTFSFVFSESTFASSRPNMDYSLSNPPTWLQLHSDTRTLYGTPGPEDAGSPSLTLIATDDTGATSIHFTLIVSNELGPGLGVPVSDQLSAYGAFSNPNSLLLSHSSPLYLSFSRSTFTNTNEDTVYYALCVNNTPLPSWIAFDSSTLSFSGTTPQSTSSAELSQKYDIQLTASDVVGFSGAIASFQIVVEGHIFSFGKNLKIIYATRGTAFSFSGLQADLALDHSPANTGDLTQIVANTPSWMSFDESTLLLSGTPPASAVSQNITVTATNIYGDVANTVVLVLLSEVSPTSFFQSYIGTLNATIGSDFDYQIDHSFFSSSDIVVSADLGMAGSWLSFDAASLKFHGSIPSNIQPQEYSVNLTASQGTQSQSQIFKIDIERGDKNSQVISSPGGTTDGATTSSSTGIRQPAFTTSSVSKKHWLPAAVIIPVAVVLGALLLTLLHTRARRRRRRDGPQSPSKEKISRPILQESSWVTVPDNEMAGALASNYRRESSRPPKIDLSGFWPSGPNNRCSQPRSSRATVDERHQNSKRDSWREFVGDFERQEPKPVVAPEPRRALERELADSLRLRKKSRQKKSRSGPFPSPSLYRNLCAFGRAGSGMGHGLRLSDSRIPSGFGGPRGFGMVRESWRNTTRKSQSSTEYTTTTDSSSHYPNSKYSENISLIMRDFPRTPTWNALDQKPSRTTQRPYQTIRPVPRSQTPLGEYSVQQSAYKRPASIHQGSPFFSAGRSSRTTSRSYWKKPSRDTTHLPRAQSPNHSNSGPQSVPSAAHYHHKDSNLQKPQRSYSCSSSVRPSSPPSTPRRRLRSKSNDFELVSPAPVIHPSCYSQTRSCHKSVSTSSSQRFHSHLADDMSEHFFSDEGNDEDELVEGVDGDGNKCWRHAGLPNQPHICPADGFEEENGHRAGIIGPMSTSAVGTMHGKERQARRGRQGGGGSEEEQDRRSRLLMVDTVEKRPVSVDTEAGLAKGASMAGEIRAFL
ncbi:hypothetical protein MMC29_000803 [Sticta canariensis]|nr:hypothetical protein [Sticta canariensis]